MTKRYEIRYMTSPDREYAVLADLDQYGLAQVEDLLQDAKASGDLGMYTITEQTKFKIYTSAEELIHHLEGQLN